MSVADRLERRSLARNPPATRARFGWPVRLTRRAGRGPALLAALGIAILTAGIAFSVGVPSAGAETWGSQNWPYISGEICSLPGGGTAPLAAWDTGSGGSPAYLTSAITSANGAAPPLASVGAQTRGPVGPGTAGLSSASQIAAVAYLLSTWGSSTDPARVAETAEAVMAATGDASLRSCLGTAPSSSATADAMWNQAQNLAGPYHVTIAPSGSASVTATVTSAAGMPVPGLTVNFSAP
ncbi:MAG: hypothetical protein JO147_10545, partial [Actinobacteria bacterium]|nr:hypothetical protein [Actinomycetota bacterium]